MLPPGGQGSDRDILRTDTGSSSCEGKGIKVSEGNAWHRGVGPSRPAQVPSPEGQVCIKQGDGVAREGPSSALTLVWKQKMVTEMDTTAVMIIAMMTALVSYTLQGRS